MQLALAIYVFSALLIAWLFSTFWRNMALFRAAARKIRLRGSAGPSFVETNRIPELSGVAEDFDALVAALLDSKAQMQRAAEENAHALKAPLSVIAQSLEPLKAALPQDRAAAQRSLLLIERSVEKLDALVSAGRDLDQASAEAVFPRRWRVNLSQSVHKLLLAYEKTLEANGMRLSMDITPDLHVMASEDLIELVIENILDNAASFTPRDGTISVSLVRDGDAAKLTISDEGPGVSPDLLDRIFDRYVSHRPASTGQSRAMVGDHFGLGLWIVRRNVEGVGGSVRAALRDPRGLAVSVNFPLTR
jgi:two-component system sensor histidine kinase ChvG